MDTTCVNCNKVFKDKYKLNRHNNRKTPCDKSNQIICLRCSKIFKSNRDLTNHMNRVNPCKAIVEEVDTKDLTSYKDELTQHYMNIINKLDNINIQSVNRLNIFNKEDLTILAKSKKEIQDDLNAIIYKNDKQRKSANYKVFAYLFDLIYLKQISNRTIKCIDDEIITHRNDNIWIPIDTENMLWVLFDRVNEFIKINKLMIPVNIINDYKIQIDNNTLSDKYQDYIDRNHLNKYQQIVKSLLV